MDLVNFKSLEFIQYMSVFNLYNEIEQELHFLLPERGTMLIVFHLYHRMKEHELERTFTEEDIKKSIRAVHSHLKTEQNEQWNQMIRALQKYFFVVGYEVLLGRRQ